MSPDTPAPALRPEELGERSITLETDHDPAVRAVETAFSDVGFTVVDEFSPAERIAKARDADVDGYTVLGLGVPAAAAHALDAADPRVGALFPCRVVVRTAESGHQEVYFLNTMRLARRAGLAPDDERWTALVAQIEDMVDDALAALRPGVGQT